MAAVVEDAEFKWFVYEHDRHSKSDLPVLLYAAPSLQKIKEKEAQDYREFYETYHGELPGLVPPHQLPTLSQPIESLPSNRYTLFTLPDEYTLAKTVYVSIFDTNVRFATRDCFSYEPINRLTVPPYVRPASAPSLYSV